MADRNRPRYAEGGSQKATPEVKYRTASKHEERKKVSEPDKPLGQWLVDNMPRGVDLEIPADRKSSREIPFVSGESE